jgi:hypothetical protein
VAVPLKYKPDFEAAQERWDAFWRMEIIDRPTLFIRAPKDGVEPAPPLPNLAELTMSFDEVARRAEACIANTYWCAEAIPYHFASFGPDQFAAFIGGELDNSRVEFGTNWAKPFVEGWNEVLPLTLKEDAPIWRNALELCRTLARAGEGKFLVSVFDLHSNADLLSAVRCPERLCLDMVDAPDLIGRAMASARALYAPVFSKLAEASNQPATGYCGWLPFYSRSPYATIQCDFLALIGPEHARRFVLPALEEEAAYLDHSALHYDGPGALVHCDDILAIPNIDVIQWVPGAGAPPLIEWMDLLKKIQKAGKGLHILCSAEESKIFHRELRPEGMLYEVPVGSEKEADELVEWFRRHT